MKPKWLKENECARRREESLKKCVDCKYFGHAIKKTKHQGKDVCYVYQCELHPKVLNTQYSYACGDWIKGI